MKRAALKITAIIMALALAFAFAACGSKAETAKPAKKEKPDNGVLATLFFASDFQQADGWDEPGETLIDILRVAREDGKDIDELIASRDKRPVFIATHVPLHFSGRTSSLHTTGDNMYSSVLFDVINEAGKDLDIFFTFGHNHSKGWDCYLGESCIYMTVGDEILIPEYSEGAANSNTYKVEKLNFTYFNAGYIGYCMNTSPVADDTLTATVCEIYADKIVLTRYSEDGEYQLESEGTANPFFDDTDLIPSEYYSDEDDSPQTIKERD